MSAPEYKAPESVGRLEQRALVLGVALVRRAERTHRP